MRIDTITPRHTGENKMSVLSSGRPSPKDWAMPTLADQAMPDQREPAGK